MTAQNHDSGILESFCDKFVIFLESHKKYFLLAESVVINFKRIMNMIL